MIIAILSYGDSCVGSDRESTLVVLVIVMVGSEWYCSVLVDIGDSCLRGQILHVQ